MPENRDLKYPPGVSAHPRASQRPLDLLEQVTLGHLGLLVLLITWAFGGNTGWSRTAAAAWGTLGLACTFAAFHAPEVRPRGRPRLLLWLWPFLLFNGIVLVSLLNPSFRELSDGLRLLYVQRPSVAPIPSTARPWASLEALWFFDAVYLSAFNLVVVIRHRRAIRLLLLFIAGNAVLLAVYGTVQKLLGASAIYFAGPKAVQPYFFSSFVYHNHWGAFTVLMLAICLGFVFHFARQAGARSFWHSPGFVALVAVLLLAATVPLSGSRSCTLIVTVLLLLAFLHWVARLIASRRIAPGPVLIPAGAALLVLILVGVFAYQLARPMIATRLDTTYEQIDKMRADPGANTRVRLYRDTWRMAREHLWFGWGMASYPTVFTLYNSQRFPCPPLPNEINFEDAHCDWLQSVAEVGFVGTALLGLCAGVPLYHRRHFLRQSLLVTYLLAGLSLVTLYAWLEFPFGNGAVVVAFWVCFFSAIHYPFCEAARTQA